MRPEVPFTGEEDPEYTREVLVKILCIFIHVLLSGLFIAGFVGQVISDSPMEFIEHFTNWAWTMHMVFYTGTLILLWNRMGFDFFVIALFMISLGTASFVMVLVFFFVITDWDFVKEKIDEHGGEYNGGVVIFGNFLYHTYPFIAAIVFLFIYHPRIRWSFFRFFHSFKSSHSLVVFVSILQVYGCLIPSMLWRIGFSVESVYGIETSELVIAVIVVIVVSIVNGIAYLFFFPLEVVENRKKRDDTFYVREAIKIKSLHL